STASALHVAFLQKTKEQMDEEDSRALKRLNESQEYKAAKKQKLDEEVEEHNRHLQIVPNDEADVYTKATPLAFKVPVVDYEIYNEHNKPYFKIKRADGSHQLYLSFLSQELEAVRVPWCADYHIYYNIVDFASGEEISTYKRVMKVVVVRLLEHLMVCDGTQLGLLILHPVELDLEEALSEIMESLKEQLKGKAGLTKAISLNPIDPALLQVDVVSLVPKLRKNRTAHIDYIRHTQEEAATLRELVESERLLSPLNTSLAYACKYTRRIQELLMILQQT
nr:hypothetical protein [Tanacetum cinerariifolium]